MGALERGIQVAYMKLASRAILTRTQNFKQAKTACVNPKQELV